MATVLKCQTGTKDVDATFWPLLQRRLGVAHSFEVWEGDELIGGTFGVMTGAVFVGESIFTLARMPANSPT